MSLQDVSNDSSMLGWLRQAGHGHLLEHQQEYSNVASSAPPQPPPPPAFSPSPPPRISGGYGDTNHYHGSYNHSGSFAQNTTFNPQSYGTQQSPTNFISSPSQFMAPHMNSQLDIDIEVSATYFSVLINFLFD